MEHESNGIRVIPVIVISVLLLIAETKNRRITDKRENPEEEMKGILKEIIQK